MLKFKKLEPTNDWDYYMKNDWNNESIIKILNNQI